MFDKPFALFMGPQRCGFSWLDQYFRQRGDICLPEDVKEIFFFDRHFQRGGAFYLSHFDPQDHHRLVMEISTTAFDHPDAPQRVVDLFGQDLKLVCPLRHPVERSYAVYQDYQGYGIVSGRIEQAAEQAPQILFASRYADHLARWFDIFGQDRIDIVFYENLVENQEGFTQNICDVLSIPYESSAGVKPTKPLHSGILGQAEGLVKKITGQKEEEKGLEPVRSDLKWLHDRLDPELEKFSALTGNLPACWTS